jgi:hypothetical protein
VTISRAGILGDYRYPDAGARYSIAVINIVKRANSKALKYNIQEIATLQILK